MRKPLLESFRVDHQCQYWISNKSLFGYKNMEINWNRQVYEIEDPNICPHCGNKITPQFRNQYITGISGIGYELISIWLCPDKSCLRHIVGLHKLNQERSFKMIRFLNGNPIHPIWPKPIMELKTTVNEGEIEKEIQTKFINCYVQSLEAEERGLDEIAGMGYRKSIEYLLKDWAISKHKDEASEIKIMWLGNVIKKYYDGDIKELAEKATWLGNDQSHYLQMFEDYDIKDLKSLIDLILVEFDREYKKANYISSIKHK